MLIQNNHSVFSLTIKRREVEVTLVAALILVYDTKLVDPVVSYTLTTIVDVSILGSGTI